MVSKKENLRCTRSKATEGDVWAFNRSPSGHSRGTEGKAGWQQEAQHGLVFGSEQTGRWRIGTNRWRLIGLRTNEKKGRCTKRLTSRSL